MGVTESNIKKLMERSGGEAREESGVVKSWRGEESREDLYSKHGYPRMYGDAFQVLSQVHRLDTDHLRQYQYDGLFLKSVR